MKTITLIIIILIMLSALASASAGYLYTINVSGGNQSLYNFTGTDVRNFDCDTVAPAKNTTYFDNIVAYYPFDCSGNGFSGQNNGTIYGASMYVIGKYGKAVYLFDNTGYVNVGHGLSLNISTITVEAWVKPVELPWFDYNIA